MNSYLPVNRVHSKADGKHCPLKSGAYLIHSSDVWIDHQCLPKLSDGFGLADLVAIGLSEDVYKRQIIYYQTEPDGQYVSRTAWVIGFLEEAERMELELTLQDVNGVQGTLTLEGTKVDDHCFFFASTPEQNRDTGILWLEEIRGGVLRIYDGTDTLLEERTYDVLSLLADE